jgi:hypothetical protein
MEAYLEWFRRELAYRAYVRAKKDVREIPCILIKNGGQDSSARR